MFFHFLTLRQQNLHLNFFMFNFNFIQRKVNNEYTRQALKLIVYCNVKRINVKQMNYVSQVTGYIIHLQPPRDTVARCC